MSENENEVKMKVKMSENENEVKMKVKMKNWIYKSGIYQNLYKSKTISGTGFLNFLPISELTLTVLISTGQYRSNESKVES